MLLPAFAHSSSHAAAPLAPPAYAAGLLCSQLLLLLQVATVCLGLALQGFAPEPALAAGLTTAPAPTPPSLPLKLAGAGFMLLCSLAYSFLGVSYDLLVRSEGPTPTHSEVMFYTAKIGEPWAHAACLSHVMVVLG